MAALSLVRPALLTLFIALNSFSANVQGNVLRLFSNNPPDFVNVQDLKLSVQDLVDKIGNRLRCDDHGLEFSECVKCIDSDYIIRLLKLDPLSKYVSRQNAEELAILMAHQILYFESMCVSLSPGCSNYKDCEEEVLEVMGRYSSLKESLVKVLRMFKMYLKEENQKQCLNVDQVLSDVRNLPDDGSYVKNTRRIFAVIMGYIFKGYCIDSGESVTDFVDDLFHHYGDACSPYMTINGFKRMIHDLQSGVGNDHDHNHHHSHHHDNEHDHDHECEHKHGEYSHYHGHSDHIHNEAHQDNPPHLEHNDTLINRNHHHHHLHDHDDHHDQPKHDHPELISNTEKSATVTVTVSPSTINVIMNVTEILNSSIKAEDNKTPPTIFNVEDTTDTDSTVGPTKYTVVTANTESSTGGTIDRVRRSEEGKLSEDDIPEEFNQPARSLRSDFSLPEDRHHIETNHYHDDSVKKVYLLENEDHNRNVELSGTPHQFASLASKCLSVEQLMQKFGHPKNGSLSKEDFYEICPALIQQIVSGVCTDPLLPPPLIPSKMEVYGYSSLAVLIISLSSLIGVLLLPFMGKKIYTYIISGFCGLAFSTLTADALLHLVPQFLGLHTHGSGEDHGHSHDEIVFEPYVQLMLGVFATIYALFLFESIMSAFSASDHHSSENKGHGHSHSHLPDELPTLMSIKTKSETHLTVSRDQSSSSLDTEIVEVETMKKPPNLMVNKPIIFGLTSLAIVITVGDSVHNFGDGLAIGAAFSTGLRGGLSTAIAVLFHELPHEFGDFVVLLSTGLSFSKALWINFLSSLTCFAGLYIGILIGDNEDARKWVMVVTAGTFLYVALGEMLPDLREHHQGSKVKMLVVKNLGILAGIALMFLISIYESKLV